MKTLNIILLSAFAAVAVSCSTDRIEDEVQVPVTEKKLDLKPLKTENNQGNAAAKVGDSTMNQPTMMPTMPVEPTEPTNPNGPGTEQPPVVDPTKPDKPW